MNESIKPLLFVAADALDIDIVMRHLRFTGSRKETLELFEGYSPIIVSNIEDSLIDVGANLIAARVHIFGNLGVILVVDGRRRDLNLFIFDRAKADKENDPWGAFWSRRVLHKWLESSCNAIYRRDIWDTEWTKLAQGPKKLCHYNKQRNKGQKASKAYSNMWANDEKEV
jgi:hypothetical protein